ncbi:MAG: SMC family ATPase, partial [Candidatus Diapherotrites archaeon]|nr:SMC family ATPase [Candidatus Diapherotrites archaeon]
MIKSVSLQNWKTHRETKMDFGKGTNVLIGIVGAGKSSVMDAICYGLFGTFPGLNAKRLSTDEVIMNSPNEMDYSKVEVEFFYKENEYKVERMLYRGKKVNEAKLYKNNEFFIGPKPSDVNEKIEELLELNFDLFSRAVYSEQNQIDYFLKLTPAQRKQKFDELLDLEKYETARSNAVLIANRLKKNLEEKTNWVKELSGKMNEAEISELKTRINAKNKEFELLQKKNLLIEEEAVQLVKEISALHKLAQETKFLQEMEIRLSAKEEELKKTLKIFEQEINEKIERYTIDYANKMLQDLELKQKMLKEQEEKIKELQRNISSANETKTFLETQWKEKQSTLPAKNIEELNEKINELLVTKVENTKLFE